MGCPRPSGLAHLRLPSELGEPFQRLVDTGLRLNEVRDTAELEHFVVDELTELSGADRVLLVFEGAAGPQIAGALLPRDEDTPEGQATLLQAITPWLNDARSTRAVALRHGPEGAPPERQRSCLVAPLMSQHELLGYLYADLDGEFGRFTPADRDLLATLASQAAVALANVRTQQGLERTVAERTAQAEQRAGELGLINRIQQGIAAKLDFQGIVDAVGENLARVFGIQDLSIWWWDDQANTVQQLYGIEHGQRLPARPAVALKAGSAREKLLHTGVGGFVGSHAEQAALGIGATPGTDWALSLMAAPIRGTQRVLGQITLENHEREHAYGEADLRVLTTIGATLGTALENARLFDETQRRNAELAVINSIQQAIAGASGFDAIAELVGDKLCEVFHCGHLGIDWNEDLGDGRAWMRPIYGVADGRRVQQQPFHVDTDNPLARALRAGQVLRCGSREEQARRGIPVVPGASPAESLLLVPALVGGALCFTVHLKDPLRRDAFSEADARLVQTVAGSMAPALLNAKSFEAERQRNAELAADQQHPAGHLAGSLEPPGHRTIAVGLTSCARCSPPIST